MRWDHWGLIVDNIEISDQNNMHIAQIRLKVWMQLY